MASTIENEEVGARLRDLRFKSDLSQRQFADFLGISLRAYQNYERGERKIPADIVRKLVDKSDINPIWLLSGSGLMYRNSFAPRSKPIPPPSDDRNGWVEFFLHPDQLFGDEEEDKDEYSNILERGDIQEIIEGVALDPKYAREVLKVNPTDGYIVYIEDDAMSPYVSKGDFVLVNSSDRKLSRDGIFAVSVNNRVVVRRLQVQPGKMVQVISDNPAFPPYIGRIGETRETIEPNSEVIRVLGRVVWKAGAV